MKITKPFEDWLVSKDCYGNNLLGEWEKPFIISRFKELDKSVIYKGDIRKEQPNSILVDITYLSPDKHKGKKILITLSHFIRPCQCTCDHTFQYECYLSDCNCCSGDCT